MSEFGGVTNKMGHHGAPHALTAYEKLRRQYRSTDAAANPDENVDVTPDANHEAFEGLLPEAEQLELRDFTHGEVWEEMNQ